VRGDADLAGQRRHVAQEEEEELPVRGLKGRDEQLLRAHLEVLGILQASAAQVKLGL